MVAANPKERVIAINKQIVALGRERRLADALAQLDALYSQRLKPTAVTFNVLIAAAALRRIWASVVPFIITLLRPRGSWIV